MKVLVALGNARCYSAQMTDGGRADLILSHSDPPEVFTSSTVCVANGSALVGRLAEKLLHAYPDLPHVKKWIASLGSEKPILNDLDGNRWLAEGIGALALRKIKSDAENFSPERLEGAIVVVPMLSESDQTRALLSAFDLAELPILGIVEECDAILGSLAQGAAGEKQRVLILDFGFNALKFLLIEVEGGSAKVNDTASHPQFGSETLDLEIAKMLAAGIRRISSIEADKTSTATMIRLAETIKLRILNRTHIDERLILRRDAIDVRIRLSDLHETFIRYSDRVCVELVQEINRCFPRGAGLDHVICIGGGNAVPFLRDKIRATVPINCRVTFPDVGHNPLAGAARYWAQNRDRTKASEFAQSQFTIGVRIVDRESGQQSVDQLFSVPSHTALFAKRLYYRSRSSQNYFSIELVRVSGNCESTVTLHREIIGPMHRLSFSEPVETTWSYHGGIVKFEYMHRSFGTLSGSITVPITAYHAAMNSQKDLVRSIASINSL